MSFENYTILIIDDSTANLGVVFEYLDNLGFELMVAQNGESGLKKACYEQPDIILLDAVMPGLDGFEVCRRLKSDTITREIPVIFMTGLTGIKDKVKGFEVGAVDYVTKPIRKRELLARLTTHLSMRNLTRQLQQEVIERSRAEEALTVYRDQLEELLKQRTAELTEANEQLRAQSEQLRALAIRLAEVEETERRRLARELHDRVGQDLGILDVNLNIIRGQLPPPIAQELAPRFDDALDLLTQIATQVYDVTAELRSPVLEEFGIVAALKWHGSQFVQRTGIHVTVRGDEDTPRLPLATESAMLRITQEALANVAKHAQASHVMVKIERENKLVRLSVTDDGIGFDLATLTAPATDGRGWGVMSMTERAEAMGGHFQIKTGPQQGTQIIVEVPL
jgi:signal transduction histidine kinase